MALSFLIHRDQLQVLADRKIIKQAEYASVVDASGLLEAAREESARLNARAQAEAAEERQRGYDDGWQAARERLAEELARVAASQARALQQQREAMARAVTQIARELVAGADGHDFFDMALRRVSESVRAEQFLSLRVHAADAAAARVSVAGLMDRYGSSRFVNVVADPHLTPRSCIVESELGLVDASLDGFVQRLEHVLAETFVADAGAAGEGPAPG